MFWLSNFLLCVYLIKIILKYRHDHNKLNVCIILFEQYWLTFPIKITKTTCYLKSTQRSYALEIYVLTNLGTGRKCYMLEPVNMITSFPYKLIVPNYQIKWLLNLIYDIVVTKERVHVSVIVLHWTCICIWQGGCPSELNLLFSSRLRCGVLDTPLCDIISLWIATGRLHSLLTYGYRRTIAEMCWKWGKNPKDLPSLRDVNNLQDNILLYFLICFSVHNSV